eukprot:CAMPEP_0173270124 /NCGR_PEP_ID=MMETSP1143-20121109/72_1 /TAXON_ID=483371 /ORGANISM="non described non described, Strain CCMP2298" /LENGTH=150 /DNA_ID=CAMNT_0014206513 /DNA_START=130 /DNA_END=578 /DNA_ORIENTATION=-
MLSEVDAHGHVDLFADASWDNVQLEHSAGNGTGTVGTGPGAVSIRGLDLNCLLRGMFLLYGVEHIDDSLLPGGYHCWEGIVGGVFVTLPRMCGVQEVIRRVQCLLSAYCDRQREKGEGEYGTEFGEYGTEYDEYGYEYDEYGTGVDTGAG